MKTGLALEGGAMRGMFTCGVLDVFWEEGVRFDGAAAISAGATFGCNFKSGQAGRAIRYNLRYCRDPRYGTLRSLRRTGDLYDVDFCYRELPEELDPFDTAAYRENPMAFYVGATDVRTGRAVFHNCRDGGRTDIQWMRASASMPLVSRPVMIGERLLLDGGIVCPVPFSFLRRQGYGRCVAVLTQPRGFRKQPSAGDALIAYALREMPAVAAAMRRRYATYNRQMDLLDALERAGDILTVRPPAPPDIRRTEHDPVALRRIYQWGRATALLRLEEVRRYLAAGE